MGTKVESKTYFPGYHSMRDLNNNMCNGMWDLYREEKTLENNQYPFLTSPVINGYEGNEKEQLKQTILKQESVFRHQLQELHRLYKKQRDLMNECTRKELHNHPAFAVASKPSFFSSQFPSENSKESLHVLNFPFVGPSFGRGSTSGTDIIHPPFAFEKGKCMSQRKMFDLELPADLNHEGIRQKDKIPDLADLNEPIQVEETSSSASLNNFKNKAFLQEELLRRDACKNSNSGFWFSPQGFSQNHFAGMAVGIPPDKKLGRDGNIKEQSTYNSKAGNTRPHERSYIHSDHSSTVSNLVQVEPGKARESLPSSVTDHAKTEPQLKRTLFGVDIFEGSHQLSSNAFQAPNSQLSNSPSNVMRSESTFDLPWGKTPVISGKNILALQDNSLQDYSSFNFGFPSSITSKNSGKEHFVQLDPTETYKALECANLMPPDTQKHDNFEKGLPWLLTKPHSCAEQINGKGGSLYQMNLDSLQNNSPQFFKKVQTMRGPTQVLSKDSSSLICARDSESVKVITNECQKVTKSLGFPVVDVPNISGLRHHIDLNLALNEEESPLEPSLSKAVVKIATTDIDLEAPTVLEPEEANSQKSNSMERPCPQLPLNSLTDSLEEVAKVAAEAIMTISSLSYQSMEASASDSLLWFADVVSSEKVNEDLVKVRPYDVFDEESNIPEGMDEFEFMTLKLKDTNEEENCYKPMIFENENSGVPTKRPRRGQGKRGRQRKDFQRDILPSLVSLARREVTEDLQTFEEAFTSLGDPWQSSISKKKAARNGRGRKRLVGPTPPAVPIANAASPTPPPPTMQASCREVVLEEKSLSGWGKRTRRLPRQRCINSSSSHALALKC